MTQWFDSRHSIVIKHMYGNDFGEMIHNYQRQTTFSIFGTLGTLDMNTTIYISAPPRPIRRGIDANEVPNLQYRRKYYFFCTECGEEIFYKPSLSLFVHEFDYDGRCRVRNNLVATHAILHVEVPLNIGGRV